ncbi:MAG: Ig-like domain-containing protein, partial [Isosphaerales bacterium]
MPEAASIPPDVPKSYSGAQSLGDVELGVYGNGGEALSYLSAFTGVGFPQSPVAEVDGFYNDFQDKTLSDYHAQINSGDSPSWDTNTELTLDSSTGYIQVECSHTYTTAGTYDVTVYITGPDGQTASATTSEVNVTTDRLSVTLNAPDVTNSNAASEVPYSFSLVFQNSGGMISGSSVSGATVQVVPRDNEAITATLASTELSGTTDGAGDASTITANYQITPPNGDWSQGPMGTYTVNLGGSPVTGIADGQAPQGNVGTFQVNVPVKLVLEVPQYDTGVPEDGTIPVEVQALGPSGNPDPGVNGTGTIQLNGKVVATVNLQNGTATTTITAPSQPGQYQLQGYVSNLDSGSTGINVGSDEPNSGELLSAAANSAGQLADLLKGLIEEDLKDPNQVAQAALTELEGLKNTLGKVIPFLNLTPLAIDLSSLWNDATQRASPQNEAQFQKDFSNALKEGMELDVAWGVTVGLELNPIGAVGGFLLNSAIQQGVGAFYDTFLQAGAMTTAGQLYQALKGSGSSVLLQEGVQYYSGSGDPPPSIILVNPPNGSSGAENLTVAGQSVYAQAGTSFNGVVATSLDASGNTNAGAYSAYIAWGDGNFTEGTISALPGGGFEVTGSDTYASTGTYSVSVVVTSTDGNSAAAYSAATVYPTGPTGATSAPVVSLLAPNISSENADWLTPYTFSVVYQDSAMVSFASLAGSTVQVQPPTGPAITAQEISTQILGSTDVEGDGSTTVVTYELTPPTGNWYAAPPGTYTVNLGGSPVTDLSGNSAAQGSVGTIQVSVPPTLDVSPAVGVEAGTGATISNSASLVLSGYAEASSTVEIYNGTALVNSAHASGDGSWSFTYQAHQNGSYDFTAVATDSSGNTSAPSDDTLVEVDTVPPTSTVAALPATTSSAGFTVSWSGSDNTGGSGIALYDVYVSDNGGPFTAFQTDTIATSASFTGVDGHTYGFYSVATDAAGNVQTTPMAAQATTEIDLPPPPPEPSPPVLLPADSNGSPGGETTTSTNPYLVGTTLANVTVELLNAGGVVVNTTQANGAGGYQIAVPGPLSVGSYQYRVVVADQYGDASNPSAPQTITVINTPTPTPTPTPPLLVTAESLQVETIRVGKARKAKKETVLVLQFSGALNAGAADNANAYELAPVITVKAKGKGKHKQPATTKLGTPVTPASAVYTGANNQVTLTPRGTLNLKKPEELIVNAALLTDALGREIDGKDDGQAGGDYIATINGSRVTPGGLPLARTRERPAAVPAAIDALLAHGELTGLTRSPHAWSEARPATKPFEETGNALSAKR